MISELTQAQRKRIRMINYWAFLIGAFLSIVFAGVVAIYSWWMPMPFLGFSAWLFRLMHLSGFKEVPDSKFDIPNLMAAFLSKSNSD